MYRAAVMHSRLLAICCLLIAPLGSDAQVPPHQPGTICATPQFWCWAVYPGPPGAICACPTNFGWVQGRLI